MRRPLSGSLATDDINRPAARTIQNCSWGKRLLAGRPPSNSIASNATGQALRAMSNTAIPTSTMMTGSGAAISRRLNTRFFTEFVGVKIAKHG